MAMTRGYNLLFAAFMAALLGLSMLSTRETMKRRPIVTWVNETTVNYFCPRCPEQKYETFRSELSATHEILKESDLGNRRELIVRRKK